MGSPLERRCASSTRCVDRERLAVAGREQWVGALLATAAGMCESCTTRAVRSINGLPRDVVQLTALIGATGYAGPDVGVARSRELPVPIRLGVEALRAEIDFEVGYWAEVVGMETVTSCRLHARVSCAALFLAPRVDTLLQLGPQERSAWTLEGEPLRDWRGDREITEQTGIQGAMRLIELHHQVRRATGRTQLVHRLTPACPWCDQRTLVRHNGSNVVECESCDKKIDEAHYSWFVQTLARQEPAA